MYFSLAEFHQLVNQAYNQVAATTPQHLDTAVGGIVQNPETMEKSVIPIIPSSLNPPFDTFQQGLCKLFVQELGGHTFCTSLEMRAVKELSSRDKKCLFFDPFSEAININIDSESVSLRLTKMLLEQEQQTQQTASEMQKHQQTDLEKSDTTHDTQEQMGFVQNFDVSALMGTGFKFDVQDTETQAIASTSQALPLATKRPAAIPPTATPAKRVAIKPLQAPPPATVTSTEGLQTLEELEPLPPFDPQSFAAPQLTADTEGGGTQDDDNQQGRQQQTQEAPALQSGLSQKKQFAQSLLDEVDILLKNNHPRTAYAYYDEELRRYNAKQLTQQEFNNYQRINPSSLTSLRLFAEQVLNLVKGIQLRCVDIIPCGSICEGNLVIQGLTADNTLICVLAENCKIDKLTLEQASLLLTVFIDQQAADITTRFGANYFKELRPSDNQDKNLTAVEYALVNQVDNLDSLGECGKAQLLEVTQAKWKALMKYVNKRR